MIGVQAMTASNDSQVRKIALALGIILGVLLLGPYLGLNVFDLFGVRGAPAVAPRVQQEQHIYTGRGKEKAPAGRRVTPLEDNTAESQANQPPKLSDIEELLR